MRRIVVLLAALVIASQTNADAQAPTQRSISQRCVVDTKAGWYRLQAAWLPEKGPQWSNDSLRRQLLQAVGPDTGDLHAPQLGAAAVTASAGTMDTSILGVLRAIAKQRERPWPTRSIVGVAGTRAALRLAELDTALERTALHRMMEAGPGETLPADVAALEDRLRVRAGRGQLYGTQMREITAGGTTTLAPFRIEDSVHVDMRRESAGLPPLQVGVCLANQQRR